jgi:hypothetical protein
MADIQHLWGNDISIDDQGDIATVYGTAELAQRLVRRFCTNPVLLNNDGTVAIPPDYRFEPTYGEGVRRYVDSVVTNETLSTIQTRLMDGCQQEAEVSTTTPPVITVTAITGGISVDAYVTMADGTVAVLPQMDVTS